MSEIPPIYVYLITWSKFIKGSSNSGSLEENGILFTDTYCYNRYYGTRFIFTNRAPAFTADILKPKIIQNKAVLNYV